MAHEHHEAHAESRPGPGQYIKIAIILAILTAFEVAIFYWETADPALMTFILLGLSLAKFTLVVGYFMHLKFDNRLYTALFVFPMIVMVSIGVALLALFMNLTR